MITHNKVLIIKYENIVLKKNKQIMGNLRSSKLPFSWIWLNHPCGHRDRGHDRDRDHACVRARLFRVYACVFSNRVYESVLKQNVCEDGHDRRAMVLRVYEHVHLCCAYANGLMYRAYDHVRLGHACEHALSLRLYGRACEVWIPFSSYGHGMSDRDHASDRDHGRDRGHDYDQHGCVQDYCVRLSPCRCCKRDRILQSRA